MAKGKRINCIYECKDITWRTTNYIKLYDMILSNVVFNTKKVVKIEHPFSVGDNFFQRIANQNKFTKEIKNKIILKKIIYMFLLVYHLYFLETKILLNTC